MRTVCVFALSAICFANASSPKGEPRSRCEFVCSYAQSKLVSPSGRDVAQRQRGLESADMAFQICPDTGFFCFPHKTKESTDLYSLLWWEVVDSLFCGKATPVATCIQHVAKSRLSNPLLLFSTLRVKQKRAQICTLFFGGRWWIRTTEVVDNRFTVCPLWPLGKPPIFTCRNRGAGGRT